MQRNHPGVFIVLEGSDGSGKGTQFRLLAERLKAVGHEVAVFDFPRYDEPSSHFVRRYLNGEYGPASEVSPYTASIFYALDRYEASPHIKKAIGSGKVVLANRYVGSNMAHQGTKFSKLAEQRGFFMWADSLEYQLLGIPRPNINLFLKVPAEISFELIAKKTLRGYTDKKRDEHEADLEHIKKAVSTYDLLCKLLPRDFKEIDCTRDGQLLTIVEINDKIWESLKPLLPEPKRKGKAVVLQLDQPLDSAGPKNALKNESDSAIESILLLQKQMLAKSGSAKGINQQRLKAAINHLTPLLYKKSEIRQLLSKDAAVKSSSGDEPMPVNEIIERLTGSIPAPADDESIILRSAIPRNEFQLLNEAKSADLNYRQKEQVLANQLKQSVASVKYRFEITSDFATLLDFKREVEAKQVEIAVPNRGLSYTVPEVIEAAGLDQPFNQAFKVSGALYNRISQAHSKDAIYSLLLGHNVRWQFEINADALSKVLKTSKKQELLIFLGLLRDKIAEYHPHIARAITDSQLAADRNNHKKRR